jgi:hypothetical protein
LLWWQKVNRVSCPSKILTKVKPIDALVEAKPTPPDRAVNPQLPPPCGFVDDAKERRPAQKGFNNKNSL